MLLSSCGGVKHAEMLMLQNVQNQVGPIDSLPVLRIQSDDILGVFVSSQVQEANASFQEGKEAESASSGEQALGVKDGGVWRIKSKGGVWVGVRLHAVQDGLINQFHSHPVGLGPVVQQP